LNTMLSTQQLEGETSYVLVSIESCPQTGAFQVAGVMAGA